MCVNTLGVVFFGEKIMVQKCTFSFFYLLINKWFREIECQSRVYLGFKISAINCKRLIKGLMNRPKEGLPTLLYNHLFSLFSFQRTYRVRFAA